MSREIRPIEAFAPSDMDTLEGRLKTCPQWVNTGFSYLMKNEFGWANASYLNRIRGKTNWKVGESIFAAHLLKCSPEQLHDPSFNLSLHCSLIFSQPIYEDAEFLINRHAQ